MDLMTPFTRAEVEHLFTLDVSTMSLMVKAFAPQLFWDLATAKDLGHQELELWREQRWHVRDREIRTTEGVGVLPPAGWALWWRLVNLTHPKILGEAMDLAYPVFDVVKTDPISFALAFSPRGLPTEATLFAAHHWSQCYLTDILLVLEGLAREDLSSWVAPQQLADAWENILDVEYWGKEGAPEDFHGALMVALGRCTEPLAQQLVMAGTHTVHRFLRTFPDSPITVALEGSSVVDVLL